MPLRSFGLGRDLSSDVRSAVLLLFVEPVKVILWPIEAISSRFIEKILSKFLDLYWTL